VKATAHHRGACVGAKSLEDRQRRSLRVHVVGVDERVRLLDETAGLSHAAAAARQSPRTCSGIGDGASTVVASSSLHATSRARARRGATSWGS
jgi:hypothetical protein